MATFRKQSSIKASARVVYAWHLGDGALEMLIPPWEKVRVMKRPEGIRDGERAVLEMKMGPLRLKWVAEHHGCIDRGEEGGEFTDVQLSGPFAAWTHTHRVRATGADACVLEDRVEYRLPLAWVGRVFGGGFARRKLERMFEYRHMVTRRETEGMGGAGASTESS